MTARELIKNLEACDLDKTVSIVVSIIAETEDSYGVLLREIQEVIENEEVIGIQ